MRKILITLVFFLPLLSYGTIHYVSEAGAGLKNGANWANAYDNTQLQSAISTALTGDEVWVAKGTYKPTIFVDGETDRHRSFQLKNNVAVYGGFSGSETSISQRVSYGRGMINETFLSGDIGTIDDNSDNCYHVFHHPEGLLLNSTALIDGFTITGGNANSLDSENTQRKGGGMFNESSAPSITNVIFYANYATEGGGFSSWGSNANSVLTNVTFISNTAVSGGGMSTTWFASPILYNVIFTLNSAYTGGGISINNSGMILNNVTFASNIASNKGGGVEVSNAYPVFNNCIIWGNTAPTAKQLYNEYVTATLNYTCYANAANDVVMGGGGSLPISNCINDDPQFIDAANGNYQLYSTSPCLDAGNDAANITTTDFRGAGFPRKLLKTDYTQTGAIDMGAYEYNVGRDSVFTNRIFVNAAMSDDNGSGRNWYSAKKTLQAALSLAVAGDSIWVAKGTYIPTLWVGGVGDRFLAFQMKNNVAILGGFSGNEIALSQRSQFGVGESNETILSADVGVKGVNTDNCYHVFNHPNGFALNNSAILDGFTITGGYANGESPHNIGGGMLNILCSPTLNNVSFIANLASIGGGIHNDNSSPIINSCTFNGNVAHYGGGISNMFNAAPSIINSVISNNIAILNNGGGIYNHNSTPVLTNVLVNSNSAEQLGGGIYSELTTTTLNNVTIASNLAAYGGGIYNYETTSAFNNCIIWENQATNINGHNLFLNVGTTTLNYSCYGNALNEVYLGGTFNTSNNNTVSNPLFFDVASSDYTLLDNSPCIGAGNNSYNTTLTDLAGNLRKMGNNIDMGAYEWDSGIENTISIADSVITSGNNTCFNAYDTITMAGTDIVIVENTATVNIIAGKCVRLLPGFHALTGSNVNAYITTDDSFCEALTMPIITNTEPDTKSLYLEGDKDSLNIQEQPSFIKLYPNPNNGKFTIELVNIKKHALINIYNVIGECIYQCSPNSQAKFNIELPKVKKGIYFVKVKNGDSILSHRMIIN